MDNPTFDFGKVAKRALIISIVSGTIAGWSLSIESNFIRQLIGGIALFISGPSTLIAGAAGSHYLVNRATRDMRRALGDLDNNPRHSRSTDLAMLMSLPRKFGIQDFFVAMLASHDQQKYIAALRAQQESKKGAGETGTVVQLRRRPDKP